MASKQVDKMLELIAVWVISASAIGLVLTLVGHFQAAQVWLASLLTVFVYAWRVAPITARLGASPDWRHLVLLSLVCLFFRLPAYHYVLGGQDEGVYVNLAHYISRSGGVSVHDTVLRRLEGSAYVQTYLSENRYTDGIYLPGIYASDGINGRLEFQFYHLFPMWMALFGGLFGGAGGIYALTFFAWLSVVLFYRLAFLISGSKTTAIIAGLLLAVNPLHVFFSKFPVTEVPTLAFSLIGFTWLAAFWVNDYSPGRLRWLWISAGGFAALFVTRISGFMYMPFIIALAMAGAIMSARQQHRRALSIWAISVVALYTISVWYGFHWSDRYSSDIYRLSFDRIFHHKWRLYIVLLILLILSAWTAVSFASRSGRAKSWISQYLVTSIRISIGPLVLISLVAGIIKIYKLGWTDQFQNDVWLNGVWHFSRSGLAALFASSLYALFIYDGPFLPICFLIFVLYRHQDSCVEFLRVFAAGFFVYAVLLQWNVPYGPYYARYLLSELVPYLSLFVLVAWSEMPMTGIRRLISASVMASVVYMALASSAQLGKNENDGLYSALGQLLSTVDSNDLVLIDDLQPGLPTASEIKTSLVYTFGSNVVSVTERTLSDRGYLAALDARYDDVYLISTKAIIPNGFVSIGSTRIHDWALKPTHQIPRALWLRGEKRLYLSRLTRIVLPLSKSIQFNTAGPSDSWRGEGWGSAESWGTWTVGKYAHLRIDPRQLPYAGKAICLHFGGVGFVSAKYPEQRVRVFLNGVQVGMYDIKYPNPAVDIAVNISRALLDARQNISIDFELPDAISPKSLGINADDRLLGLGISTILAVPLDDASTSTPKTSHAR